MVVNSLQLMVISATGISTDMKELGEEMAQLANIKGITLGFPDNLHFTFQDFLRGYRLELIQ